MSTEDLMSEMEFVDIFADNLRDLMYEHNIGQIELAKKINVDRSTINRYLNKTTMPSVKAVVNMCIVFDIRIDDLIPTYELIF